MLLGNINYLVQKMSSTVVSSLMTGVPIIADSHVLASYTFLKPEHVFLIGPQETEMDVMQRVSPHNTADDAVYPKHAACVGHRGFVLLLAHRSGLLPTSLFL